MCFPAPQRWRISSREKSVIEMMSLFWKLTAIEELLSGVMPWSKEVSGR
jgi:hypothetical protein